MTKPKAKPIHTDPRDKMIVDLCACLNAAIRIARPQEHFGAVPDGTCAHWAETIKRGMALVADAQTTLDSASDTSDLVEPATPEELAARFRGMYKPMEEKDADEL